jgi:hypothetical protein
MKLKASGMRSFGGFTMPPVALLGTMKTPHLAITPVQNTTSDQRF